MAKMFAGNKTFKQVKAAVKRKGWLWDQSKHDDGGDWVSFEFRSGADHLEVLWSSFNGRFIVRNGATMFTESSVEAEDRRWYSDLLDFLYVPMKSQTKRAA